MHGAVGRRESLLPKITNKFSYMYIVNIYSIVKKWKVFFLYHVILLILFADVGRGINICHMKFV